MSPEANRFVTDTGLEVPAVTTEQMREIDRIAIEETGPNLYQMMENAGRNLALLAMEVMGGDWQQAKMLVLAGSGGNGGGGICAARHLANRGADVTLCLAEPDRLGEVPSFQQRVYRSTPGKEVKPEYLIEDVDLIVDALIGYSLQSAPRGVIAELIEWANAAGAPVLSLDVPSGVDATTGETPGEVMESRWTMTLALPKTGLGPSHTGSLSLADIGIPAETYRRAGLAYTPPFGSRFRVRLRRG